MEDLVILVNFLFRFEKVRKEEREYIWEKLEALQQLYNITDFDGLVVRPPWEACSEEYPERLWN